MEYRTLWGGVSVALQFYPERVETKKRLWGSRHVGGSRQRSISAVDFGTFQSEKYMLTISPFMSREVATPGGGFADRISK